MSSGNKWKFLILDQEHEIEVSDDDRFLADSYDLDCDKEIIKNIKVRTADSSRELGFKIIKRIVLHKIADDEAVDISRIGHVFKAMLRSYSKFMAFDMEDGSFDVYKNQEELATSVMDLSNNFSLVVIDKQVWWVDLATILKVNELDAEAVLIHNDSRADLEYDHDPCSIFQNEQNMIEQDAL